MAKKGDIYLGGVLLSAYGRKLTIGENEISKEERTVSGRLVRDIIATKKRFKLSYELIDGDDLEDLLDLYDLQDECTLLIYHTDDGPTTEEGVNYDEYTVLIEPISDRTRLLLRGNQLWENAEIVLNEV
jgi:hypothetical protein